MSVCRNNNNSCVVMLQCLYKLFWCWIHNAVVVGDTQLCVATSTMNVHTHTHTLHCMAYLRNSTRNMMSRITRITTTIAPTAPPTAATGKGGETRGTIIDNCELVWLYSSTPLTSHHDTMCSGCPTLPGHLTTVGTSYFTGALCKVQTNGARTT